MSAFKEHAERLADGINRFFAKRSAKKQAAEWMVTYAEQLDDADEEINRLENLLKSKYGENTSLREKLREAESLHHRINMAIKEQNWSRSGEPVAIILSPYQAERFKDKKYRKLPILVASGLHGPLVVTQKGLDGLSRQAPELTIRKA